MTGTDEVVLDEKGIDAAKRAYRLNPSADDALGNAIRAYLSASVPKTGELVRLADCPPGLFRFGDHWGYRSEYATTTASNPNQPDAYVLASGEYFWGGCTNSLDRSDLMVEPVSYLDAIAAWNRLPSPTDTRELSDDEERLVKLMEGTATAWEAATGPMVLQKPSSSARTLRKALALINRLKSTEAPVEDGWVEWDGGECPVKKSDRVQVRFRTGDETTPLTGANDFNWKHINEPGDIIAYRLAASTKERGT